MINTKSSLEVLKENGEFKPTRIMIEGVDFQQRSIESSIISTQTDDNIVFLDNFYFDSTITIERYRYNRALLFQQLDTIFMINRQNALRLNLFSTEIMLNYLLDQQDGSRPIISEAQIQLIIDLVVEILDEAYFRKIYVMLIMWNYTPQLVQAIRVANVSYINSSGIRFKGQFKCKVYLYYYYYHLR